MNDKGEIKEEIAFPAELLAGETRFGFEGITVVGEGDDMILWMAVQREWKDDQKGREARLLQAVVARNGARSLSARNDRRRLGRSFRNHRP